MEHIANVGGDRLGNEAGKSYASEIYMQDPSGGVLFPNFFWMGEHTRDDNNGATTFRGGGHFKTATSYNAVRFFLSAGNITSGIFELYGIG